MRPFSFFNMVAGDPLQPYGLDRHATGRPSHGGFRPLGTAQSLSMGDASSGNTDSLARLGGVRAWPAVARVRVRATMHVIISAVPKDGVVVGSSKEVVISTATPQRVGPSDPIQGISSRSTVDDVVARSTDDCVLPTIAAVNHTHLSPQPAAVTQRWFPPSRPSCRSLPAAPTRRRQTWRHRQLLRPRSSSVY